MSLHVAHFDIPPNAYLSIHCAHIVAFWLKLLSLLQLLQLAVAAHSIQMQSPHDLKVPELHEQTICKNKENYLEQPSRDGEDKPGKKSTEKG